MISKARERLVARLRTRRGRPREGRLLAEGVRCAEEALAGTVEIDFAVVAPDLVGSARGRRLLDALGNRHVEVLEVDAPTLGRLSDTESPQGVLLVCFEPTPALETLAQGPGRGLLILDGLQDPGNLGTLVRAAHAFELAGVLALDGTVDPWNPKAVRASAGASFHLPVIKEAWEDAEPWLKGRSVTVWVADAGGEDVARLEPGPDWALAVGSEAHGAREAVKEAARGAVAVPMRGGAESLNAGVAGAILLYAFTSGGRT